MFLLSNSQFSSSPSSANHAFPDDFWIVPVSASLWRRHIKHEMVFVKGLLHSSRLCEKQKLTKISWNHKYPPQHTLLKLARENKYVSDVFDFDLQSLNKILKMKTNVAECGAGLEIFTQRPSVTWPEARPRGRVTGDGCCVTLSHDVTSVTNWYYPDIGDIKSHSGTRDFGPKG